MAAITLGALAPSNALRPTYAWLDGRDSIVLSEIKTNVPVDAAKFGKPAPLKPR